jgi:hypothetical protein
MAEETLISAFISTLAGARRLTNVVIAQREQKVLLSLAVRYVQHAV